MADFYCPLDEFEFEYKGRWVSCIPAGGAIASVGGQARPSKPILGYPGGRGLRRAI